MTPRCCATSQTTARCLRDNNGFAWLLTTVEDGVIFLPVEPVQTNVQKYNAAAAVPRQNNAPCNSRALPKWKGPRKGPSIRLTYQHTASRIALVAVDQASLANLSAFVSRLSRCGLNLAWQARSMTPRSWNEGSVRVSTRLENGSRALVSVARNSGGPVGVRLKKAERYDR